MQGQLGGFGRYIHKFVCIVEKSIAASTTDQTFDIDITTASDMLWLWGMVLAMARAMATAMAMATMATAMAMATMATAMAMAA